MDTVQPQIETLDMELCEISSESSWESPPEQTPRVRIWRRKYDELFSETHVPTAAWEQLDNGQWACHVSRMVFATAVQSINHQRKWQYQCDLAVSYLREDGMLLTALEQKAQEEKQRQKSTASAAKASVKRKNTEHILQLEARRLLRANRRLEREVAEMQLKLAKMPGQHQRQLRRIKWNCQRKATELAALLEAPRKGNGQEDADKPGMPPDRLTAWHWADDFGWRNLEHATRTEDARRDCRAWPNLATNSN